MLDYCIRFLHYHNDDDLNYFMRFLVHVPRFIFRLCLAAFFSRKSVIWDKERQRDPYTPSIIHALILTFFLPMIGGPPETLSAKRFIQSWWYLSASRAWHTLGAVFNTMYCGWYGVKLYQLAMHEDFEHQSPPATEEESQGGTGQDTDDDRHHEDQPGRRNTAQDEQTGLTQSSTNQHNESRQAQQGSLAGRNPRPRTERPPPRQARRRQRGRPRMSARDARQMLELKMLYDIQEIEELAEGIEYRDSLLAVLDEHCRIF
ncbi:hypothetical protein BDZ91DRAFT_844315 [Kalaharituber pfeilii]|nr:hypothetical protein BDZ91DRAFT_844315 [Kalaharituber pfeilii]